MGHCWSEADELRLAHQCPDLSSGNRSGVSVHLNTGADGAREDNGRQGGRMGDKGGKKDKEKNRQQQVQKQKQEAQRKQDKARPIHSSIASHSGR